MEQILFYLEYLSQDMFTAFGIFSLFYLFISKFFKNEKLIEVDLKARKLIIYIGLVFIIVWNARTFQMYFQETGESKLELEQLMFGKYYVQFWSQPVIWFILTQLYRIKKISSNYLFRIFSSIVLIFSINKLVFFLSAFHRDYLPSSWSISGGLGIYPSNILLELLVKIIFFVILVLIFDKFSISKNK